jgi:dTDP-4-dehydrorhamnose reductase
VFDGVKGSYAEGSDDALRPTPVNAYGASKLAAEQAALSLPSSIVLRLSLVYGPPTPRGGNKTSTFLQFMDASLSDSSAAALQLFRDEIRCPIAITDVCDACCRLVTLFSSGLEHLQPFLHQRLHCGGPEALSRVAMGEIVCSTRGYSFRDRVQSVTRDEAMASATFKFKSPPDISMKGTLFQQLLKVMLPRCSTAPPMVSALSLMQIRTRIHACLHCVCLTHDP